jgi:hypothetical protein
MQSIIKKPELTIFDHDEDCEVYLNDNFIRLHKTLGSIFPVQ